jgi:putative FmdB family regulatory protein
MPSYDYRCSSCEALFEVRRSFKDANDPAECPQCGSLKTQKKLSAVAFISKGGSDNRPSKNSMPVPVSSGGCGCGACSCGAN